MTGGNAQLNRALRPEIEQAARRMAAQQAQLTAERHYHDAWRQYYQHYYAGYYQAALKQLQERYAAEAEQAKSHTSVRPAIPDNTKRQGLMRRLSRKAWFWPAVAGAVVVLVACFVQFNAIWFANLAAFVSPGASSNSTIIVGTGEGQPVSTEPRIIIPKINVNAPVTYGLTDLSEQNTQTALQNGPINYPVASANAAALPGQKGNTVILGHSSADFFAPGNYKFIFVQLNRLSAGDLFYLDYGGKRYTYKITSSKVITPTDIQALNLGVDKPYATLITCDPPGTIKNRLLIFAEQVSPDPNAAAVASGENTKVKSATAITGKPKTLFEKIFGF